MNRTFKRILTLVLATLLVLPVLAGCGEKEPEVQNPASDDSGVKLWYAYNTENFMQDLEYEEEMEERDYTLRMHGIRADIESIQLMITPDNNVVSFDLTMADLPSAPGRTGRGRICGVPRPAGMATDAGVQPLLSPGPIGGWCRCRLRTRIAALELSGGTLCRRASPRSDFAHPASDTASASLDIRRTDPLAVAALCGALRTLRADGRPRAERVGRSHWSGMAHDTGPRTDGLRRILTPPATDVSREPAVTQDSRAATGTVFPDTLLEP